MKSRYILWFAIPLTSVGCLEPSECQNVDDCNNPACSSLVVCTPEDCANQIDDNDDALIDCEDPDCSDDADCSICGDGILDSGEECDDGNPINGDTCENDCTSPVCGNGILDSGEECDDGNNQSGDICNPDCTSACEPEEVEILGDGADNNCDGLVDVLEPCDSK